MWIRTQNKQRIVNTDQTISIFVDRTGTLVVAEVISPRGEYGATTITLGEYKDRGTCLRVLDGLYYELESMVSAYVMPLGGEV